MTHLTEYECEQIRHNLHHKYRVTSDKELLQYIANKANSSNVAEMITDNILMERIFHLLESLDEYR